MKIQVLSDLHNEFFRNQGAKAPWYGTELVPGIDVLVLAGDIDTGINAKEFIEACCDVGVEVVYVPGNHEGYTRMDLLEVHSYFNTLDDAIPNFHYLNRKKKIINGVEFIGATLWTDGRVMGYHKFEDYHRVVNSMVSDFRLITHSGENFTFLKSIEEHHQDLRFITDSLNSSKESKRVVVTHHLPSDQSIAKKFEGDPMNMAFASKVGDDLIGKSNVWIHGHTHSSCDYQVGQCRVLCNPRGYPKSGGGIENNGFNPELVIEL